MNFKSYFRIYLLFSTLLWAMSCSKSGNPNEDGIAQKKRLNSQLETNDPEKNSQNAEEKEKVIVFFGNSLTAGYGLDPTEAYPALIQAKIDSLGLNYEVVNAGLSGETTASGKNRVEWILKQEVDVFILELGANDGLRGIDLDETKSNLQQIIDKVKKKSPDAKIVLTGMQIPPNMGAEYARKFRDIFPDLARKNDVHLIPFLLQDVGGEPELNLEDGIHPNVAGHKILAENVWSVLKGIL